MRATSTSSGHPRVRWVPVQRLAPRYEEESSQQQRQPQAASVGQPHALRSPRTARLLKASSSGSARPRSALLQLQQAGSGAVSMSAGSPVRAASPPGRPSSSASGPPPRPLLLKDERQSHEAERRDEAREEEDEATANNDGQAEVELLAASEFDQRSNSGSNVHITPPTMLPLHSSDSTLLLDHDDHHPLRDFSVHDHQRVISAAADPPSPPAAPTAVQIAFARHTHLLELQSQQQQQQQQQTPPVRLRPPPRSSASTRHRPTRPPQNRTPIHPRDTMARAAAYFSAAETPNTVAVTGAAPTIPTSGTTSSALALRPITAGAATSAASRSLIVRPSSAVAVSSSSSSGVAVAVGVGVGVFAQRLSSLNLRRRLAARKRAEECLARRVRERTLDEVGLAQATLESLAAADISTHQTHQIVKQRALKSQAEKLLRMHIERQQKEIEALQRHLEHMDTSAAADAAGEEEGAASVAEIDAHASMPFDEAEEEKESLSSSSSTPSSIIRVSATTRPSPSLPFDPSSAMLNVHHREPFFQVTSAVSVAAQEGGGGVAPAPTSTSSSAGVAYFVPSSLRASSSPVDPTVRSRRAQALVRRRAQLALQVSRHRDRFALLSVAQPPQLLSPRVQAQEAKEQAATATASSSSSILHRLPASTSSYINRTAANFTSGGRWETHASSDGIHKSRDSAYFDPHWPDRKGL